MIPPSYFGLCFLNLVYVCVTSLIRFWPNFLEKVPNIDFHDLLGARQHCQKGNGKIGRKKKPPFTFDCYDFAIYKEFTIEEFNDINNFKILQIHL